MRGRWRAAAIAAVSACGLAAGGCGAFHDPSSDAPLGPPSCADCTTLQASGLPQLRAGNWQETLTSVSNPQIRPMTITRCDHGESIAKRALDYESGCQMQNYRRTASGAYEYDVYCARSDLVKNDHYTFSGDFSTGYTSDQTTTIRTHDLLGSHTNTVQDHMEARYVGDCPGGNGSGGAPAGGGGFGPPGGSGGFAPPSGTQGSGPQSGNGGFGPSSGADAPSAGGSPLTPGSRDR